MINPRTGRVCNSIHYTNDLIFNPLSGRRTSPGCSSWKELLKKGFTYDDGWHHDKYIYHGKLCDPIKGKYLLGVYMWDDIDDLENARMCTTKEKLTDVDYFRFKNRRNHYYYEESVPLDFEIIIFYN